MRDVRMHARGMLEMVGELSCGYIYWLVERQPRCWRYWLSADLL